LHVEVIDIYLFHDYLMQIKGIYKAAKLNT